MVTATIAPPLTMKQAAARLGISDRTVRRMVKVGKIPAVRIGKSIRIPMSVIESLLKC